MSVNRRSTVLGILFLLVFLVISPALAAGALGLGLTVVDENGDPITSVETGQVIEYIIDFSCGDLTDGCGDLEIDFPIDTTLVTFEDVITSPGYQGTYPGDPAPVTIINVAPNDTFDGGESAQARIRVRVREDLDGSEVIPAQVTGSISQSGPPPQNETQTATNPNLDVAPPTEEWSIVKTQTAPSGVPPAPGGTATFRVQFCPDEPTGNISIINPRIVDTFPVGADVVDAGGGVESGNTLTWNLTPNPLPPSAGCQSVTYTLRYPVASFPVGVPIDNVAEGFGDNPELGGNGICENGCTNSEIDQDVADPIVDMVSSLTKTGPGINTVVAPGNSSGTSTFSINLDLSGANTPTSNVILTDELPLATDGIPATSVTVIDSGTWADNTIQAVVEITTTLDGTWQPLGTVNGTPQSWSSAAGQFIGPGNAGAPNTTVDLVTGVRWRFLTPLPPGFVFNNGNAIRFIIREGMPALNYNDGTGFNTFNNCVDGTGDFNDENGVPQTTTSVDNACAPVVTSDDTDGFANVTTNKESNVDEIDPLDFITFTLTVELTEEASGNLINPAIEDILPPGLNFVNWDSITIDSTGGDIVNNPYLLVEDDVLIDGEIRDRLLFYWDDTDVFPGSVTFPGPTPTGELSLVPPETGNKTIEIVFTAQALLSAAAGPYDNGLDIAAESPNLLCQDGGADTDDDDIDNDGVANDVLCSTNSPYEVREAAEMGSQKWIRSVDGVNGTFEFYGFQNVDTPATASCPTYSFDTTGDTVDEVFTRFPCVAEGLPTENFEYLMRMYNTGLVDTDNYIMYDILPFIGDTGVSQLVAEGPNPDRLTEFEVFLTGPIEIEALPTSPAPSGSAFTPPTFIIEYNLTTNPCRPEMANGPDGPWSGGCNDVWYTAGTLPGGDWSAVRSFRIMQTNSGGTENGVIPPQTEMVFSAPMQIAAYGDAAPLAETGEIAWNSFAQRFSNALSGTRLLVAEPPKVGIVVAQRYSVGNRVWIDTNNNGVIDGAEEGLDGVTVELWRDDGGGFALFRTDVTRTNTDTGEAGYYFFGNLDGGPDIDYQIRIPATEFQPAGQLHTYVSSTGNQNANNNNNTDSIDTGRDPATTDLYNSAGISTNTFTLTGDDEAEGETDVNADGVAAPLVDPNNTNEGPLGRGEDFEDDPDSDLTIDLGFYKPHSIGNRVWLDDGNGNPAFLNDGIINNGELGINGVEVALYRDTDNDGVVEPEGDDGGPVATTVTANGGYYLFDLLPPDQYVVHIVPDNFTFGATAADDGPLADYITSTPTEVTDNETDNDDNGINPATEGDQRADGVFSPTIDLEWDGEIITEVDKDTTLTEPDGRRTDFDSSELTVDFGFFEESTFFSVGNRVWDDINNNGVIDAGETGIAGVELALYLDDNGDGIPDDLDGDTAFGDVDDRIISTTTNPQRTLITNADGYYLFDNLNPGRYLVYMVPENWTTGQLAEYISSTGNTATENTESNDNGIDPAAVTDYPLLGVVSNTIQLVPQGEPENEADPDPSLGDPSGNADDNNSDLTVDFGVYRPLSLGNRVWLDNGNGDPAFRNDGIINNGEGGIPGVTVNLYADPDGDGVPDGAALATDTTDAGGYYLFDNLTPGNYVVEIPFVGNFEAGDILEYHESSIPADPGDENGAAGTEEEDDATDHGEYPNDTQVVAPGVLSDSILLEHDSEALNDNDTSADPTDGPARRGNFNEADDNSDLTVDFGFYVPPLSIGNRVWFDNNNNGVLDGTDDNPATVAVGDPGIDGVLVNLYGDFDGDGVEDLAPLTTTTDADGYYLFDNLAPGDYRVELAASNFVSGPLQGLVSSTGNGDDNDEDTDTDENGIDPTDLDGNGTFVNEYSDNGVTSVTITLLPRTEPEGGDEVDRSTDDVSYGVGNNGTTGEDDNGSNLTVDFAVFRPLSIGNRVWQDADNNGVQDPGEPGIDGVLVELYIDANGDGDPDTPGTPYRSTVTVTDSVTTQTGYYIFDNLPEGNYVVEIAERNFQNLPADADPTNGIEAILFDPITNGPFFSSEPVPEPAGYLLDDGSDLNDNGIDEPAPQTDGVRSDTIVLTYNTEPSPDAGTPDDETDLNTDVGEGRYGELDINADMTIDFGFYIPAMSIGNRVFFDYNNDRQFQPDGPDGIPGNADDEAPIAGVTVNLFATDAAGNVIDQDGDTGSYFDAGDIIASELTNADGYYLFDDLQPGFYVVVIDENNFRTGGLLVDYISSEDTAGVPTDDGNDQFENGIDNPTPETGGVRSPVTELVPGGETATEVDKDPIEGDGEPNIEVTNSDLTVDFGFYRPMSLGNRVWFDIDDSGTINGSEGGIPGVAISLYPDTDGDGIPDGGAIDNDVTDANGYYLFDNLTPGGYVVGIDNANFDPMAPLDGLTSSTLEPPVTPEDPTDSNDNGFNLPNPTYGIISNNIQLVRDTEPLNETDLSNDPSDGPNSIGNTGEIDSNSDVTVDFGFTGVQMSLGNRVWYDPNDNGIIDAGEVGIENIVVNLFRDNNGDNVPDGAPIATTITDANGYYLFDGLAPGTYIVGLAPSNFNGGILTGLLSSTGSGTDNQQDTNVDENGIDPATLAEYTTTGVLSDPVVLTIDNEPLNEFDPGPGSGNATDINSDLTIDFGVFIPQSIGNRVWFDTNGNGIIDGTETGVPGVTITLLRDNDGDGTFEETVDTDTTDATGHYLFDGLPAGSYTVVVDDTNFDPGGALEGLTSSPDTTIPVDDNPDRSDHGIDPATAGDAVSSPTIALVPGTEPPGETDLSGDPADGPARRGNNGESDLNSDLTVDFGFTGSLMSLGNRVWLDDGAGVPANRNNGQRDAGELGIGNVLVNLYADANADGVPDGAPIATTITSSDDPATALTDEGGYYLFDGLAPGNYLVGLDAGNFNGTGVLVGLTSSTGNGDDNQIDSEAPGDENGIDNTAPVFNGIFSTTITLATGTEPVGEPDPGTTGSGTATDDNSDITVDFGLFPSLSLGNRIWFDPNDNGTIDVGEVGIPGVDVSLYADANADGLPDGAALDTDTTDASGYYLFDGLEPGTYVVVVDDANFDPGGALEGFTSSTGSTGDTGTDLDDNGLDTPITEGIGSVPIVLSLNGEVVKESDLSGDTTDGPNFRGNNSETDANSDLTIDFGFNAETMSLGNRVWLDNGGTTGTANDGTIDGDEAGIDGVVVELYADINNDNIPDGGVITTTVTTGGGYYLFDNLPPGDYIVRVAPSNFDTGGALYGLVSSTGSTGDDDVDSNDNGTDTNNPGINGVSSETIMLTPGTEATGETDSGTLGSGNATDENSNITVDFGFVARYDRGDAPDSYGTTIGATGPAHQIVSNLYLGNQVDDDDDGAPTAGADGDDIGDGNDDEDGINIPTLVAGTSIPIEVTAFNNTGVPANAVLWIDFNGDGVFDAGEAFTAVVPSSPTSQVVPITITVPIDADTTTGGDTYARLRLTTDPITTPTGIASNGEVEDYVVTINPPGLVITKTDGQNAIVVGQATTYTITINNSGVDRLNVPFTDTIPTGDPNGFDPASISWTCTASGGANCVANSNPPVLTRSGTNANISELIDVPRNGQIIYTVTATLRAEANAGTILNTATAGTTSDDDDNGIIFDPPVGVKTGTVIGGERIRWSMTWINTGGAQTATITDTLPPEQTFDGNLICQGFGTSTTTSCTQSNGTITWTGNIGTGQPNRVVIAFDVIVPGDGDYTNTASIDVNGERAAATDTVTIGEPPVEEEDPPEAGLSPIILDPAIVKLVNPAFAQPGEPVVWTIIVSNPHDQTLFNVGFIDDMPAELDILEATSTAGEVTVNGQIVTFRIDALGPQSDVTVTVRTQLGADVETPFIVDNTANLDAPYTGDATARVVSVEELPATGESPPWRDVLLWGLVLMTVIALGGVLRRRHLV